MHWAKEQGLLEGERPLQALGELEKLVQATLAEKRPPQNVSTVEPFREVVRALRKRGVEMLLTMTMATALWSMARRNTKSRITSGDRGRTETGKPSSRQTSSIWR